VEEEGSGKEVQEPASASASASVGVGSKRSSVLEDDPDLRKAREWLALRDEVKVNYPRPGFDPELAEAVRQMEAVKKDLSSWKRN
jgi:hypothetical protein